MNKKPVVAIIGGLLLIGAIIYYVLIAVLGSWLMAIAIKSTWCLPLLVLALFVIAITQMGKN